MYTDYALGKAVAKELFKEGFYSVESNVREAVVWAMAVVQKMCIKFPNTSTIIFTRSKKECPLAVMKRTLAISQL